MEYKISLCTVCMNRAAHLKCTLPRNLQDHHPADDIQFVLLDYNSSDDLRQWVLQHMQPYIDNGLLVYYHTPDPVCFHMSHAKNMAFRLADGDILCGIDADNYTGPQFAGYVRQAFRRRQDIFLTPPPIGRQQQWWDVQGRICVRKDDFERLRGYDERIGDYGYEDQDLKFRLRSLGRKKTIIRNTRFLEAIRHDDCLRIAGGRTLRATKELFLTHLENGVMEVLFLQHDQSYEIFRLKDQQSGIRYLYTGQYEIHGNNILLFHEGHTPLATAQWSDPNTCTLGKYTYSRITAFPQADKVLLKRCIHLGKQILLQNKKDPDRVNPDGFGCGTVYRNFSTQPFQLTNMESIV